MAFGGMILTNKGRALQAKTQTGTILQYTRIKVGDGNLGGQSIPTLNDLISSKMSLGISKLQIRPDGKAVVGTVLNNTELATGFYFREIGVFATDPDMGEILYCYDNSGATAEYIPAGGGPEVVEKHIDLITIVQNAANVTATIDQSLVWTSQQDFDAKFSPGTGHKHSGADGDAPQISYNDLKDKPTSFAPSAHAASHKTGGSDALSPSDIGAETPSGAQQKAEAVRADGTKTIVVEVRTTDPASPVLGQMWFRSDL